MHRLFIALLCSLVLVAGCQREDRFGIGDLPAETLLEDARKAYRSGAYETALEYLGELEKRFPYNEYGQQAGLEIPYVHYLDGDLAQARAGADRFIQQYPSHSAVDYAYYLKGLSGLPPEKGLKSLRVLQRKDKEIGQVDPGAVSQAHASFADLVARFPESRYTPDARRRMAEFRNDLAAHEIRVAQFYFEREVYVAVVNRGKYVLKNYEDTPATEDALGLMALAYEAMELPELAHDTLRVLRLNYPNSRYLQNRDG